MVKGGERLVPHLFQFLVLLAYDQSRLITVPQVDAETEQSVCAVTCTHTYLRQHAHLQGNEVNTYTHTQVMQRCDGVMASGHSVTTFAIPALLS